MSEPLLTATLASKKRACELGAHFIENDLRELRTRVRCGEWDESVGKFRPGAAIPATSSHENDVMKAMEWASAATWLRAMAEAS